MKIASRAFVLLALFAAVGCGSGNSGSRSTGEQIQPGSDLERMQGMWELVAFETARPGEGPGPDKIKAIRLTFTGEKLVIGVGVDYRTNFLVALDSSKEPKRMTVTEIDQFGRPTGGVTTAKSGGTQRIGSAAKTGSVDPLARSEWIYKFEGDVLILAVADPGQPAPTDFTPRTFAPASTAKGAAPASPPGGRVDIVRLKKTTVPASGGTQYGTSFGTYRGTFRSGTSFSTSRFSTGRVSTAPSTAKK